MTRDGKRRRHGSGSPYEAEVGFCRALRVGDRVLVAGTAPIEADGESVAEDAAAQARRCGAIALEALAALGADAADVVRTRTFLVDRDDWAAVARVHGEHFGAARPVATMVVVAGLLDPRWRVELEVEAVIAAAPAAAEGEGPDDPARESEAAGQGEGEALRVEPLGDADRDYVRRRCEALWGDETVVTRGAVHRPAELPGLVAWLGGQRVGHAVLRFERDECELLSLEAELPGRGVGRALLARAARMARYAGVRRLWLVTTNDNIDALAFYRRVGFAVAAVHVDALEESRRLKPAIPATGAWGIPLRDEIELERLLGSGSDPPT